MLYHKTQTKNLNIDDLEEFYEQIISYPNLNINATCTGEGSYKGISVLLLVVFNKQWNLADKLIRADADINATCISGGPNKDKSILGRAKAYNVKNKDNSTAINKDIFYIMAIIMYLQYSHFAYPKDVVLLDEDQVLIKDLTDKITLYTRIFTPQTSGFEGNNSYKKNNLNELPEEIRQLIAIEYIKEDLQKYNLSYSSIEHFSHKIAHELFKDSLNKRIQAQQELEAGPHLYELVLYSSILTILRNNTKMVDIPTRIAMSKNKNILNEIIFKDNFLPAFEKIKAQNTQILNMNFKQRLGIYAIAKEYGNGLLKQKPEKNTLTEEDFLNIFNYKLNITAK